MLLRSGRAGIARVQKLLLVDAALNGIESLFVDQRLVLTVNENDILICKVAAVAAGRIPAQLADIDGVAQDVSMVRFSNLPPRCVRWPHSFIQRASGKQPSPAR